jgi:hypothetical protein
MIAIGILGIFVALLWIGWELHRLVGDIREWLIGFVEGYQEAIAKAQLAMGRGVAVLILQPERRNALTRRASPSARKHGVNLPHDPLRPLNARLNELVRARTPWWSSK